MKMVKCSWCQKEISNEDKKKNWHFGKLYFCSHSCTTAWNTEHLIKYHPALKILAGKEYTKTL